MILCRASTIWKSPIYPSKFSKLKLQYIRIYNGMQHINKSDRYIKYKLLPNEYTIVLGCGVIEEKLHIYNSLLS